MVSCKYPFLSLPIETKNRELEGKVLLAAKAINRGWAVILGKQSRVFDAMAHGLETVHIEISIPDAKFSRRIKPLADAGHKIANLCEEGVIYPDGIDYCQRKVGANCFGKLNYFFANGQKQKKDVLACYPGHESLIKITGNPRFDLLHSPYRSVYNNKVQQIRGTIKRPFVLINTNFASINPHPAYGRRVEYSRRIGGLSLSHEETVWSLRAEKKRLLLDKYISLIRAIDEVGYEAVVRPHPSENFRFWSAFCEPFEHIRVIHDGSANAWMLASSLVITSGCTTGIEAFILGRPIVTYCPQDILEGEAFMTFFGDNAASPEDVLQIIAALDIYNPIKTTDKSVQESDGIRYYIENSNAPSACDSIVASISEKLPTRWSIEQYRERILKKRRSYARSLISRILGKISLSLPTRLHYGLLDQFINKQRLTYQKFSGLSTTEVASLFEAFLEMGVLNAMPIIEDLGDNLFLLYPRLPK